MSSILYASKLPYGETRIRYQMTFGTPSIEVNWNGKKTECFVDTGCSQIVSFAAMNLPGEDIGQGGDCFWAGKRSYKSRLVRTDLEVGRITVRGAVSLSAGPKKVDLKDLPSNFPLLGNTFLEKFCVTFDPVKHELILRKPEYKPSTKGAFVLEMRKDRWRLPYVYGQINGKRAKFTIDTGWSDDFVFNQQSGDKFFSSFSAPASLSKGVAISSELARGYSCVVGPITLKGNRLPTCWMATSTDTSLGWPLLSNFETTFDFKRGRLILRPIRR